MSQATSGQSSSRRPSKRRRRREDAADRRVFLRFYGDLVDELNSAVRQREAQGWTQITIAKRAGLDPAVLSRVLSGRAGTNVRTVAAVLNGTDFRMKLQAVPCERLREWRWSAPRLSAESFHVLHFENVDDKWRLVSDHREHDEPLLFTKTSKKLDLDKCVE